EPADEGLDLPPPPDTPPGAGRPLLVLDAGGHTAMAHRVLFTPDGSRAVSAGTDKTVRVWDVETGDALHTFYLPSGPGNEGAVNDAALPPDGQTLAAGGVPPGGGAHGMLIYLISLDTGQVVRTLKGHENAIVRLAFSRDGRWLVSGSGDKTAILYDLRTG